MEFPTFSPFDFACFFHTYAQYMCVCVCLCVRVRAMGTFCNKLTWKLHSIHVRMVFRTRHVQCTLAHAFRRLMHLIRLDWRSGSILFGLICFYPPANLLLHVKRPSTIKYLCLSFLTLYSKATLNHTDKLRLLNTQTRCCWCRELQCHPLPIRECKYFRMNSR